MARRKGGTSQQAPASQRNPQGPDQSAFRGDDAISEAQGIDALLDLLPSEGDTSEESIDDAEATTLEAEPEEAEPQDTEQEAFSDDDLAIDEEDDLEPEPSQAEPEGIELTFGDERVRMTADEIQKGYLRQADYSRKTADLARDRESNAAEKQALEARNKALADTLDRLARYETTGLPPKPDAQLRQDDLATYLLQKEEYEDAQRDIAKANEEAQRQQADAAQQWQRANASKLIQAMPAWTDANRLNTDLVAMRQHGIQKGWYDEATFNQDYALWPHWALEAAHKAILYDRAVARKSGKTNGAAPTDKRVVKTTKSVKSQASQTGQKSQKTSRVRDAKTRFLQNPSGGGADARATDFLLAQIEAKGARRRA